MICKLCTNSQKKYICLHPKRPEKSTALYCPICPRHVCLVLFFWLLRIYLLQPKIKRNTSQRPPDWKHFHPWAYVSVFVLIASAVVSYYGKSITTNTEYYSKVPSWSTKPCLQCLNLIPKNTHKSMHFTRAEMHKLALESNVGWRHKDLRLPSAVLENNRASAL